MSSTRRGLAVGALFLCAFAVGSASADATSTTASPASHPATVASAQRLEALDHVARIERAERRVRKAGDAERDSKDGDALKAACLTDKLHQLKSLAQRASDRLRRYEGALARGDVEETQRHLAALATLHRRADSLDGEANQCMAPGCILSVAGTSVVTTIDPNIVNLEPTAATASSLKK